MMLAGILFWLSPRRRRFRRQLANPVLANFKRKARQFGSEEAFRFISTLLDANCEFFASALSPEGLFASAQPTQDSVAACLRSTLLYCASLYAREELAGDHSDLLVLLARILDQDPTTLMLKRDALRKTPRSEEWLLYGWLCDDLGLPKPAYNADIEKEFGFQYLSYIGQYRDILARSMAGPEATARTRFKPPSGEK